MHKVLPSTTLYCKTWIKHFPTLLCTTKLAQSTSQFYFVLLSSRKILRSITLYYKARTEFFQVHTTLYYKTCSKYFPVLLCTTKLAQSTAQQYFALQALHKVLPRTALNCKVVTSRTFCTEPSTQTSFYTHVFFQTEAFTAEAFTHRSFYTQQAFIHKSFLHTASFYTHTHELLHREAFTHRSFYTHKQAFTQRSFYTQKLLHPEAFTHTHSLLHREAFTHRSFYTQKLLHTEAFTQRSFYKHTQAFTQRSFYTHTYKLLHREAFTHRSFCAQKLLHKEDFAAFTCTIAAETATPNRILVPKRNKDDFEALVSKKKARNLLQPLQRDLLRQVANTNVSTHMATQHDNNHMQLFQCDLQPHIPQHQRTTHGWTNLNIFQTSGPWEEPITRLSKSLLLQVTSHYYHYFPKSTHLHKVTASLSDHFSKAPLHKVTTTLSHHFPKSRLP